MYIYVYVDWSFLICKGVFKCIDFGLAFSVEEEDLHQVILLLFFLLTITIITIVILILGSDH